MQYKVCDNCGQRVKVKPDGKLESHYKPSTYDAKDGCSTSEYCRPSEVPDMRARQSDYVQDPWHKVQKEQKLVEAIGNMFNNTASRLGLNKDQPPEMSHNAEFQWNTIEAMFALKVTDSPFFESLTAAFRDIHSYKYLDDQTFEIAIRKRLTATGIPTEEIEKAIKTITEIRKELGGENFQEKQAGWHPNLDKIADTTTNATTRTPEPSKPWHGGGTAPAKSEFANATK